LQPRIATGKFPITNMERSKAGQGQYKWTNQQLLFIPKKCYWYHTIQSLAFYFYFCCFYDGIVVSEYLQLKFSIQFTAEFFPDRTDVQCLHRWQKVLNPELVKGPWSKEVFSGLCIKLSDHQIFICKYNYRKKASIPFYRQCS
jgi:hypothetical protein